MTNVDILKLEGFIGDIRQRLGADDENDEKYDDKINDMSIPEVVGAVFGWELGNDCYGRDAANLTLTMKN